MEHRCPHCGAPLPEQAAFCPHCAKDVHSRKTPRVPIPLRKKALLVLLALVVVTGVGLGVHFANRPETFDGMGEVFYTDGDVTYQLVLAWPENPCDPAPQIYHDLELGGDYTWPSRWYVNYKDTGADASAEFLEKVDHVTTEVLLGETGACPMEASQPAHDDYSPDATMVSYIHFTCGTDTNQVVWSVFMKNGDVIRIRQDLIVTAIETYNYSYQDYPMETMEELQALVDRIGEELTGDEVVNLYLPPVTYQGTLVLEKRGMNLYGCTEGETPTVFTGGIQARYKRGTISYLNDLVFSGSGTEVGISTASRVWATNCTLTGWKTAVLAYGEAWVNLTGCCLADNQVGLHFNSTGQSVSDTRFHDNRFESNGTAVLLENVPTDITMDFAGTSFTGNGTDINNRCDQPLDVSQAVFD